MSIKYLDDLRTQSLITEVKSRLEGVRDIIAHPFSTSIDYAVGDCVIYDDALYQCTEVHSAGSWNENHFTLSNIDETKQDKIQYEVLPTPNYNYYGKVFQYIGADTEDYTCGLWYKCKYDDQLQEYYWSAIRFPSNDKESITVLHGTLPIGQSILTIRDEILSVNSRIDIYTDHYGIAPYNVSVGAGYITMTFAPMDEILNVQVVVGNSGEVDAVIQYTTMPLPEARLLGSVLQYIGPDSQDWVVGAWYQCVYDTEEDEYYWLQLSCDINGHIIRDSSNSYTERSYLKFTGNVQVSDNSANDETIVNVTDPLAQNIAYANPTYSISDSNIKAMIDLLLANANMTFGLEGTLQAGSTSITFTDSRITSTSVYDFYSTDENLICTSITQNGTSITLTFDSQVSDKDVRVLVHNYFTSNTQ